MNLEYYDQLIEYYCPGVLSYIYNPNACLESTLLATLLKLERKNKIKIHQDKIEILEKDYSNISHMEEYVMRSVENGVLVMDVDKLSFGYDEEGIKKKLINPDDVYPNANTTMTALLIILVCVFLVFVESVEFFEDPATVLFCAICVVILISFMMAYAIFIKKSKEKIPLLRDGERIRKNLKDLNVYMKTFKDNEELKKWKNYKLFLLLLDDEESKDLREDYMHLIHLTKEVKEEE